MIEAPQARSRAISQHRGIRRRHAARVAAVQALYQIEITGDPVTGVIDEFSEHRIDGQDTEVADGAKANKTLFVELVQGVTQSQGQIDERLNLLITSKRTVDELEVILRSVLRTASYELGCRHQVPARSLIKEYVRIADAFFSGKEPSFVNGLLDKVARCLRPGELERQENPNGSD